MEDEKLVKKLAEEKCNCDVCNCLIREGDSILIKTGRNYNGEFQQIVLCSTTCLDEYEAKELLEELTNGLHEDDDDYRCAFPEEEI